MLDVFTNPVTPFAQNANLLVCKTTKHAAIIDPGGDIEKLITAINNANASLKAILLTHGHLDHVGAAKQLAETYDVDIVGPHLGDKFWLDALPRQSEMFNFPLAEVFTPNTWLADGDTFSFGEITLEVRFTPGHTPGHVIFIEHDSKRIFVGDVLFNGSVGRTDFPGGNAQQLKQSIESQIYSLPEDYTVYPGHGPTTTVGHEKRTNPFTSGRFG